MPATTQRILLNASWLIKLRWLAAFGQMFTIALVKQLFDVEVMLWPVLVVIGLTLISNASIAYWFHKISLSPDRAPANSSMNMVLGVVMTLDLLSLTTLLYVSGGPNNPFVLFYFVNLSLCAVVLERQWSWALTFVSVICFSWLMYTHIEISALLNLRTRPIAITGVPSLFQQGSAIAFVACASVIVYFMTRLNSELRKQEADMRRVQNRQAQSEKLEALGTLAAGAAHELATPMSTIAVVAADAEKMIMQLPKSEQHTQDLIDDVRLIGSELKRCRKILDRMAFDAGQTVGERIQKVPLEQLLGEVFNGLASGCEGRCEMSEETALTLVQLPLDGFAQAIRGIVQNALDVDPHTTKLAVEVDQGNEHHVWTISDQGPGMSSDTLKRVAEPFFTTKAPGKGTGLGVYLAQNFVDRLGGRMRFESRKGVGTTVTITVPLHIKGNGATTSQ